MTQIEPVPEAVAAAANAFGIVPISIEKMKGGLQNDTWRVATAQDTFVLRRYGDMRFKYHMRTSATVQWEHRFLAHLHAQGIGVAPAIPDAAGRTLIRKAGGRWSLFPFLECSPVTGPETATAAVDLLVHFHHAAELALPGILRRQRPGVGERLAIASWFLSPRPRMPCADLLKWLEKPEISSPGQQVFSRHRDWIRMAVDSLTPALRDADLAVVPRQPIHGDFFPGNLGLRRRRINTVFDLDECGLDLPTIDLAWAVLEWAWTGGGGLDLSIAETMLRRYHAKRPISESEARHLPRMMTACNLFYVLRNLAMQHHCPTEDHSRSLGHFIPRIQCSLASYRDIAGLALSIVTGRRRH